MTNKPLVSITGLPGRPAEIMAFEAQARDYAAQAQSDATLRAYQSDWDDFDRWCEAKGACAMPADPATVLAYLIDQSAILNISTLQRRLVAIRDSHRGAGETLDTSQKAFRDTWRGLRRAKGKPPQKSKPVMTRDLRRMLATLSDERLIGLRDRALLLIGFGAALRRSELVSLRIKPEAGASYVEVTPDGLVISLSSSKTDQMHAGQTIGVPYGSHPETCPVRSYQKWIEVSGLSDGPVFRGISRHGALAATPLSDKAVALVVKRAVAAAAIANGATKTDAWALAAQFAGHSLRSGLATSAAANDAPGHAIQRQLRHRKFETTAGYIRTGQIFRQNAAGMVGL